MSGEDRTTEGDMEKESSRAIKKFQLSMPLLLIAFSILLCLAFMAAILRFMPGETSLSKNLAKLVNAELNSLGQTKDYRVGVSLDLSPGCQIWTLEFIRIECGSIEVPHQLIDDEHLSKIFLVSLRPCGYLKNLPASDKVELANYFGCTTGVMRYKLTVVMLKITSLHPEVGVTVNRKEKIGEVNIKNY